MLVHSTVQCCITACKAYVPGGCVEQGVGVGVRVELSSGSSFTANTHTKNTKSEFKDKNDCKKLAIYKGVEDY